jgi:hypothetical protein
MRAISRYLPKDDYGLSQNDHGRFTDYRIFYWWASAEVGVMCLTDKIIFLKIQQT